MLAPVVVEGALFGRAADATGSYLVDVDMGVAGLGVLGYGEGDGGVGDSFAEEPGSALLGGGVRWEGNLWLWKRVGKGYHLEDTVVVIGKGFVLEVILGLEGRLGQEEQTNVHNPLRSCSVLSGGAAIVMCLEVE